MAIQRTLASNGLKEVRFKAKRTTLDPDLEKQYNVKKSVLDVVGFFSFIPEEPSEFAGKRVLVFHGSKHNTIPEQTQFAIDKYGEEIVAMYCCHPKTMRRSTGDARIQFPTVDEVFLVTLVKVEEGDDDEEFITVRIREEGIKK